MDEASRYLVSHPLEIMKTRIPVLLESGEVERFHAVPAIPNQTVAAHSWGVTIIAMEIFGSPKNHKGFHDLNSLMSGCLLHDTGELVTGDIPFTAKRGVFLDIREKLDEAEAFAMKEHLWPMPEMGKDLHVILKLSDMLEGMRWADMNERTRMGDAPQIPDRWWHTLEAFFRMEAMNVLSGDQRERAYGLFKTLSPTYHLHRVPDTFGEFKADRNIPH